MSSAHVAIGLVHKDLETVPQIVEFFLDHPWLSQQDFGVGAPMYKANQTLTEMHKNIRNPRERLRNYLRLGLLDEALRISVAEIFARSFRQRFGQGERRDIFIASGDIFRIKGQVKNLRALSDSDYARVKQAITQQAHDAQTLQKEEPSGMTFGFPGAVDDPFASDPRPGENSQNGSPYEIELKIFLDNPSNPWRRKDGAVHQVLAQNNWDNAVITEIWSAPALVGYQLELAKDLAQKVGGEALLLEQEIRIR